jgi:hypothetical protein
MGISDFRHVVLHRFGFLDATIPPNARLFGLTTHRYATWSCTTINQHLYTARLPFGDTRHAHGCCYFHTLRTVRPPSLASPAFLSPAFLDFVDVRRLPLEPTATLPPSRYLAHDVNDLQGRSDAIVRHPTSSAKFLHLILYCPLQSCLQDWGRRNSGVVQHLPATSGSSIVPG